MRPKPLADPKQEGGARDPLPLLGRIFSFSCSFQDKFTKRIGWYPRLGNPGSAIVFSSSTEGILLKHLYQDLSCNTHDLMIFMTREQFRCTINDFQKSSCFNETSYAFSFLPKFVFQTRTLFGTNSRKQMKLLKIKKTMQQI